VRNAARAAVLCGAVLTATAIGVLPASAHVTVHSADAAPGGYAELTFRVPTERNDASTVKLQVNFPADDPLASISVKPHPGWTFAVTNKKLAKPLTTDDGLVDSVVSVITWTAKPGQGIAPGEYDDFSVSAGPMPKSGTLTFPARQTYSNGSVVSWIEVAAPGAPEPEHPAPSLTIAAASKTPATDDTSVNSMPGMGNTSSSSHGSSQTASLAVAVTALIIAVVAVGLGVVRLRRPDGHS
jgi:uncharacterized protein YcnI